VNKYYKIAVVVLKRWNRFSQVNFCDLLSLCTKLFKWRAITRWRPYQPIWEHQLRVCRTTSCPGKRTYSLRKLWWYVKTCHTSATRQLLHGRPIFTK